MSCTAIDITRSRSAGDRPAAAKVGLALAALLMAGSANAEDTPAPTAAEQETARLTAETKQIEAETARLEARTAQLKAQVDALGLPKVDGKTELGTDAGKLEGWMLSSGAINAAAIMIAKGVVAGAPVALLDGDDVIEVTQGALIRSEMTALEAALSGAVRRHCATQEAAAAGSAAASLPLPAIGAVLSLLKTDTSITGFSIDNAESALINAVAGQSAGRFFIPGELVRAPTDGETIAGLQKLLTGLEEVRLCRATIDQRASTAAQREAAAPVLAKLDALVARNDAYLGAIAARADGKPSKLELAMLGDAILAKHPSFRVLRVKIEKAGGSLLKRANLPTALGAPAVGITGGLVASWRLTDPASGMVQNAGLLICRTALTNLRAVHKGTAGAVACQTNLPADGAQPGNPPAGKGKAS